MYNKPKKNIFKNVLPFTDEKYDSQIVTVKRNPSHNYVAGMLFYRALVCHCSYGLL